MIKRATIFFFAVFVLHCTAHTSLHAKYERKLNAHLAQMAAVKRTAVADTLWFEQKLDHFDPTSTATWKQRYYLNTTYFKGGSSPIFVMLGGESAKTASSVGGHYIINEYAKQFGALIASVEHRFYGESRPTSDYSTSNLKRFLTSQQAEADYAAVISYLISEYGIPRTENTKNFTQVVTFGGSYSGAVSAWMRQKYPHIVTASIASSGPVLAKENYYEYLNSVASAVGSGCYHTIIAGTNYFERMFATQAGTKKIETDFKTCSPIVTELDKTVFLEYVTDAHATFVQYNNDNNGMLPFNITVMCELLASGPVSETYPKFIEIYRETFGDSCTESSYDQYIQKMKDTTPSSDEHSRTWYWQTCAEYGYYQTCAAGGNCPFSSKYINLDFFEGVCEDVFSVQQSAVHSAIDWTNVYYGGKNYSGTQTFFTNGSVDPWSVLGITNQTPTPDLTPVEYIPGTAHCADLYASDPSDPPELIAARAHQAEALTRWLKR